MGYGLIYFVSRDRGHRFVRLIGRGDGALEEYGHFRRVHFRNHGRRRRRNNPRHHARADAAVRAFGLALYFDFDHHVGSDLYPEHPPFHHLAAAFI